MEQHGSVCYFSESKLSVRLWGFFYLLILSVTNPLQSQAPATMFINRQSSQLLASELFHQIFDGICQVTAERECRMTRLHIVLQQGTGNQSRDRQTQKCLLVTPFKFYTQAHTRLFFLHLWGPIKPPLNSPRTAKPTSQPMLFLVFFLYDVFFFKT